MSRKSKAPSAAKALSLDSVANFFRQAGIDPEKPLGNATIDFRKIHKTKFIRWLLGDALLVSEGADFPSNPGSALTEINEILDDLLIDYEDAPPEHWTKHTGRFTQSVSLAYRARCAQLLNVQDGQSKRAYRPEHIPLVVRYYLFAAIFWFIGNKGGAWGKRRAIEEFFSDEGFCLDSFQINSVSELPQVLQTDPGRGASDSEGFSEAVVRFVQWLTGRVCLMQTEVFDFMEAMESEMESLADSLHRKGLADLGNGVSQKNPPPPDVLLKLIGEDVPENRLFWYQNRCNELYPESKMPMRLRYWVFAAAGVVCSSEETAKSAEGAEDTEDTLEDANPFDNTYLVTSSREGVILNVGVIVAANSDGAISIVSAFFGEAQDIQHLATALTVSPHNPVQFAWGFPLKKKG